MRAWGPWFMAGVFLCLAAPTSSPAQSSSAWRVFKASDGLAETPTTSVSVSPKGNVWVSHSEADEVDWLDGNSVHHLPRPPGWSNRLCQSRSGQIWAMAANGVQKFTGGKWIQYPIAELTADLQTNPVRQVYSSQLYPVDDHRVALLLSDRLIEFDSTSGQTLAIRRAQDSDLGRFLDLSPARDGGIWITGDRGLAKLSGSPQTWASSSAWQEWLLPRDALIQTLRNPLEDGEGGVTVVGESLARNEKVLVWFNGRSNFPQVVYGGKIRQGWRDLDGTFWILTINSLAHLGPSRAARAEQDIFVARQYFDMAVEPKGVFWLATSEGLARYAPLAWRSPVSLQEVNPPVQSVLDGSDGRIWFGGPDALSALSTNLTHPDYYPHGLDLSFDPTAPLLQLPDNRIAIGASNQMALFDPVSSRYAVQKGPEGQPVKLLGQLPNGELIVQLLDSEAPATLLRLASFNGHTFTPLCDPQHDMNLGTALYFAQPSLHGEIWIGGSAGVGFIRNRIWHSFGPADGEIPDGALSLLEIAPGRIWCGSWRKVFEYNGKTWSMIRSGFDRVHAMKKVADGSIWMATGGGVYRHRNGSWVMNGIEEGLPTEVAYSVTEDHWGRVWTGTSRGLSLYHPEADLSPPRTYLVQENMPREIMAGTPLTLVFSGLDRWKYTPTERLLYSYHVDQGPWSSYKAVTVAYLTGLTPGTHRFEVRAMDRNLNEDPFPAFWDFTVRLPWYKEARLIWLSGGGMLVILFLAGLAVNRHLRLVRSYAEVERIVAERTRELEQANQALLHNQKMKALGTLAAGIAHDFNNILSIIKGSVQIIENNPEDKEKLKTRVSRIKTVVDQGAGIVKALLGFARPPNQEMSPCSVNVLIEDTIHLLGDRFLQDVSIRCQLAPDLPPVPGAKDLIQQMLLNLILNAADAVSGSGQVTIRTEAILQLPNPLVLEPAPASSWILIEVADNGCGIAPEIMPRIFEPFFTTKALSAHRGTGLGLSMVYEFAKDLGYGLHVESVVGHGSTFTLFMPVSCQIKK